MQEKHNKEADRFSLRKSVLIWTAGIFLGWGAAFIVVYHLIKSSVSDGQQVEMAGQMKKFEPESIEPAAGNPDSGSATPTKP
jgi:hypothetical protein